MRSLLFAFALVACGSSTPPPTGPARPEPATVAAAPAAEPFRWPALISARPAKEAPPELHQFGRLVGVWTCAGEQRQQDGSWKPSPGSSTWTWFYTLGGRAVQDIFEPPAGSPGAIGTNLRIYNPEADAWEIQWTTAALTYFERITATATGDQIVMRGEVTQGTQFPPHARRITFHRITDRSFAWTYEATKPGGDSGWQEFARLSCTRTGDLPL